MALDKEWEVYTDDPRYIKKFQSLGAEFVRDLGYGKVFRLDDEMLILRKKPKVKTVTEKQKVGLKRVLKNPVSNGDFEGESASRS